MAEHLPCIERQVTTSDSVISALSEFTKLPMANSEPFSILDYVKRSVPSDSWPENVRLVGDLPVNFPNAFVDDEQLAIAFGNLIRNACESMPSGGRLALSARHMHDDIDVAVTDTECGITAEDLPRIREPFRSTVKRLLQKRS